MTFDLPASTVRGGPQALNAILGLIGAGVEIHDQRFKRGAVAFQHAQRAFQPDRLEQGCAQQHDENDFEGQFHVSYRAA